MDKSAKIEFNGKSYTFPVITGSENEEAIDIKNLRSEVGPVSYTHLTLPTRKLV